MMSCLELADLMNIHLASRLAFQETKIKPGHLVGQTHEPMNLWQCHFCRWHKALGFSGTMTVQVHCGKFGPASPTLTPAITFLLLWTFTCYSLPRRSWENPLEPYSVFLECPHFYLCWMFFFIRSIQCNPVAFWFSKDLHEPVRNHLGPKNGGNKREGGERERIYVWLEDYELNLKAWVVWLKSCVEMWILWLSHQHFIQFKRTNGLEFS